MKTKQEIYMHNDIKERFKQKTMSRDTYGAASSQYKIYMCIWTCLYTLIFQCLKEVGVQ